MKVANVTVLNSRKLKVIRQQCIDQFGVFFEGDYAFFESSKGKIYCSSRAIDTLDLSKIRVDRVGLYVLQRESNGDFRLSMEGAQLLAKHAAKQGISLQAVDLTAQQLDQYFDGQDLQIDLSQREQLSNGVILLSYHQQIFASAKLRDTTIYNFLPKIHRSGELLR